MRLLIRRYVTAEQRKRDDFGITEDDVIEIRQDISTLRYELIDILRLNGMQTPKTDKQEGNFIFFNLLSFKNSTKILQTAQRKLDSQI